jgi:hypothetical protein
MYYLRLDNENGSRAIFKHNKYSRFYRKDFYGLNYKYDNLKLYTCKTLKTIKTLREDVKNYCGEVFNIYTENGKVDKVEYE